MKKYPIYIQDDPQTCGVYCIKMILKYYGIDEDGAEIKRRGKNNQNGMTLQGIIKTLESYSIESEAYKCQIEHLNEAKLPLILHLCKENMGHFVVLYEIKKNKYIIGDPEKGLITLTSDELKQVMTGYIILVKHIGRYYHYEDKTLKKELFKLYKEYKKEVHRLIYFSIFISIMSYLITYIYSYMIDFMHQKSPFILSCLVVLSYGIVNVIKTMINQLKEKQAVLFNRDLDKEFVYRSSVNSIHLPTSFYYQELGMMHAKLLNLYGLSDYSIQYFKAIFVDLMMVILLLIGVCIVSPILSLVILVTLFVISLYVLKKSKSFTLLYKDYLMKQHKHSSSILEYIKSKELGLQYIGERKWRNRYEQIYEREANASQDKNIYLIKMNTKVEIISLLGTLSLLFIGLYLYHLHYLTLGLVFMTFMIQNLLIPLALNLSSIYCEYKEASLAYEHFKEFQMTEKTGNQVLSGPINQITFNNVSFAYGYIEDTLKHFDINIDQSYYIIGANGSGKSTFLNLLNDSYDYRGEIFINNHSLKDLNREMLRKKIIYVKEEGSFIHGSLLDNFFQEEEKVVSMLIYFNLESMIDKLSMPLIDGAMNLSLGQRQIICILRSLLFDFDVYLFDEAFSHIELNQAKSMIKKMKTLYPNKIFLIVTHRNNLMNKGERYVIIEDGKVKDIRKQL